MKNVLRIYLKDHFDFSTLKKAGFFPKEMKHNDYEGQAKRICEWFGLESIFDYGKHEIRCHISYGGERPSTVNESGELIPEPFVTVVNPNPLHI